MSSEPNTISDLLDELGDDNLDLSDHNLADRNLADRNLADHNPADRNLADRNLPDRNLADRNLADRNLADHNLADRNLDLDSNAGSTKADPVKVSALVSEPPARVQLPSPSEEQGLSDPRAQQPADATSIPISQIGSTSSSVDTVEEIPAKGKEPTLILDLPDYFLAGKSGLVTTINWQ